MRRVAGLAALLLVLAACSGGGQQEREPTATPTGRDGPPAELPEPRTEVAGAYWDGRIAVAGGLTAAGAASGRLDLYVPELNRWEPGPALPVPLHHLGLVALGDRLYAVGGYTNPPGGDWQAQARVYSLGPGEGAWRDEPALAQPRGALGAAVAAGRIVVTGGVAGGRNAVSTESWAPGEPAWRDEPDLAQAREHLAMAAAGGRVYAIAGRLGGLETNLRSVESWAPGEPAWRAEPDLAETRGGTAAAATSSGQVCVAGGEEPQGTIASVECLTPGGRWHRAATLRVPRHGLAVAAVASNLHVVGGGPRPGLFVSGAHEVLEI